MPLSSPQPIDVGRSATRAGRGRASAVPVGGPTDLVQGLAQPVSGRVDRCTSSPEAVWSGAGRGGEVCADRLDEAPQQPSDVGGAGGPGSVGGSRSQVVEVLVRLKQPRLRREPDRLRL